MDLGEVGLIEHTPRSRHGDKRRGGTALISAEHLGHARRHDALEGVRQEAGRVPGETGPQRHMRDAGRPALSLPVSSIAKR
jgi:hypothetical protein